MKLAKISIVFIVDTQLPFQRLKTRPSKQNLTSIDIVVDNNVDHCHRNLGSRRILEAKIFTTAGSEDPAAKYAATGSVISIGDKIARVYGLATKKAGKVVVFSMQPPRDVRQP